MDSPPPSLVPFPMLDCSDLPAVTAAIAEDSSFHFDNSDPDAAGIVRLADVAIGKDSTMFLLDADGFEVVTLDARGRELGRWGRRGDGPGEFRSPVAINVDSAAVYVLEQSGQLHIFTLSGSFQRSIRFRFAPRGFAITQQGTFVLVSDVRAFIQQPAAYLVEADTSGQIIRTLGTIAPADIGQRPFIAPAFNRPRVTAGEDGRIAVTYGIDRSVDIYRDGEKIAAIRGCMPEAVLASYQEQRRVYKGRRQGSRSVVIGVMLEAGGDVLVANGTPTAGTGRITRYSAKGEPLAVYEFPVNQYAFGYAARWVGEGSLISWGAGVVRRWIVHDLVAH